MIDATQEVQSLAAFKENSALLLAQLKSTHRAITLTVDGKAEAILQDPEEYQRLRDLAALAEEDGAIWQGLEDMDAGRVQPLDEAFEELRTKHAISR